MKLSIKLFYGLGKERSTPISRNSMFIQELHLHTYTHTKNHTKSGLKTIKKSFHVFWNVKTCFKSQGEKKKLVVVTRTIHHMGWMIRKGKNVFPQISIFTAIDPTKTGRKKRRIFFFSFYNISFSVEEENGKAFFPSYRGWASRV